MTVLRRLDAVLEGSNQAVLDMNATLDDAGVVEQDAALRQAAGQAFYNTSRFTLSDLRARANRQQLPAHFLAYLDGFSPNVQDILDLSRPCDYPDARKRWSWAALWRRTLAAGHGAAGRDNHRPSRKASSRSGGRNRPTLVVGGVVRASARSLILMSACK